MPWKCPKCNKELKENDATRGNCPYCFQTFDRPEEIQEEDLLPPEETPEKPTEELTEEPPEEPAEESRTARYNTNSIFFWLSLTALCFLLFSLFLEFRPPQKYQAASVEIKTEKTASNQEQPSQLKEEDKDTKSIRAKENEIAQTILLEYGEKTFQKINEALKQERLLQQKDETKFGSLLGNPISLAHKQLQSVYTQYGQAYLLLLEANKNPGGFMVTANDIAVSDTDFAKGTLVIQPIAPPSLNAENTDLFKAVHSEPYQFFVSCTRSGKEWKLEEWIMTGTEWNFRPLPR